MNYVNQLLGDFQKVKYFHHLWIIYVVLILLICNWIEFLLCVIDIFSTYEKVIFLEDENGETITKVFQKILEESYRKLNKIWGDKGSELYNRSIKSVSR